MKEMFRSVYYLDVWFTKKFCLDIDFECEFGVFILLKTVLLGFSLCLNFFCVHFLLTALIYRHNLFFPVPLLTTAFTTTQPTRKPLRFHLRNPLGLRSLKKDKNPLPTFLPLYSSLSSGKIDLWRLRSKCFSYKFHFL